MLKINRRSGAWRFAARGPPIGAPSHENKNGGQQYVLSLRWLYLMARQSQKFALSWLPYLMYFPSSDISIFNVKKENSLDATAPTFPAK